MLILCELASVVSSIFDACDKLAYLNGGKIFDICHQCPLPSLV